MHYFAVNHTFRMHYFAVFHVKRNEIERNFSYITSHPRTNVKYLRMAICVCRII